MKNCTVELTTGGKTLAEAKVHGRFFQVEALFSLQFVISMMSLSYILRKSTEGYKFTKSQEKIIHLMYMDDIKLPTSNKKEQEIFIQSIRILTQSIRKEFCIKNVT